MRRKIPKFMHFWTCPCGARGLGCINSGTALSGILNHRKKKCPLKSVEQIKFKVAFKDAKKLKKHASNRATSPMGPVPNLLKIICSSCKQKEQVASVSLHLCKKCYHKMTKWERVRYGRFIKSMKPHKNPLTF